MDAPGGLVAAVATGDRLTALRALAGRLAADLDVCESARDVASLAARLADVLAQVDALTPDGVKEKTVADEIAERRAARGARAPRVPRASGG